MSSPLEDLLAGQRDYYRARAPSYERDLYRWPGASELLDVIVGRIPAGASVLELACGTGIWTERLLRRSADVTALDAAPEMLAIARQRAGGARFLVADVFSWSPDRRYDTVFFGFWLSHVPADRFAPFWSTVRTALADGGRVLFVDEHVSGRGKERWVGTEVAERTLPDGSAHRIVKSYVDPQAVGARLADLGWQLDTERVADGAWVAGIATPS